MLSWCMWHTCQHHQVRRIYNLGRIISKLFTKVTCRQSWQSWFRSQFSQYLVDNNSNFFTYCRWLLLPMKGLIIWKLSGIVQMFMDSDINLSAVTCTPKFDSKLKLCGNFSPMWRIAWQRRHWKKRFDVRPIWFCKSLYVCPKHCQNHLHNHQSTIITIFLLAIIIIHLKANLPFWTSSGTTLGIVR